MNLLFWAELKRTWGEYLLAAVAIALVVGALVAQRAVTASADESIHALAHKLGRNMLVLPAGTDASDFYRQRYGAAGLPETTPDRIRGSSVAQHIQMIEPRLYGNTALNGVDVVLVGLDRPWPETGDAEPAIVGGSAARRLGLAAGSLAQATGVALSVVGVAADPPDGLDDAVFVPLASAQRILRRPGEINALRLGGCWCRVDVATLASEIEKIVPGSRAVTVAGMMKAQTGSVATMKRYSSVLLVLGVVLIGAVIAALVSSQARRRRPEIGLLVAVGAPPGAIAWSFAVKAALAGVLGGAAGWLLAALASRYLGPVALGAPLALPPGLLVPCVLLTAIASFLASLLPARQAAALDPTDVLRET